MALVGLDVEATAIEGLRNACNDALLVAVVIARARFVGHDGRIKGTYVKVGSDEIAGCVADISGHGDGLKQNFWAGDG